MLTSTRTFGKLSRRAPPNAPLPRPACHSPTFQCRLTAKYKAIGADAVRFVNSELTNIALVKAGRNVLISYRCSFNLAQDDNSMTECEREGCCGGEGASLAAVRARRLIDRKPLSSLNQR